MQNLFISPDDEFIIKLTVATDKNDAVFCDIERESIIKSLEDLGRDISDFVIEDYIAIFRKPSFGDSVGLYSEVYTLNDSGVAFNPIEIRHRKISVLIKSWNLKGKEEKPTEEDINQLNPVVAAALGICIDLNTGGIFD